MSSSQDVKPNIVKLLVVENIMLQPSVDVYILPLSFVDYRVERRKRGKSEVVPMPSDQYTLELTNYTVGELDTQRSRVTGLVVGYTEAVLQDKSILFSHWLRSHPPTVYIAVLYSGNISWSQFFGNLTQKHLK